MFHCHIVDCAYFLQWFSFLWYDDTRGVINDFEATPRNSQICSYLVINTEILSSESYLESIKVPAWRESRQWF